MSTTFTVGLIQVNATNELAPNIAFIEEQTRRARDAGAQFVMTPVQLSVNCICSSMSPVFVTWNCV